MPGSLLDHFRQMARNNAWSNDRLYTACSQLTRDAFAAERVSFFRSLCATLNHILVADRYYLAHLTGVVAERPAPIGESANLAASQDETDHALVAFCDRLDPTGLDRIIEIEREDGVTYRDTVEAILTHLFVHQIHHRGQAHAMLSGTTVPPPQLDEFFLAMDRDQRDGALRRMGLVEPPT